MLEEIRTILDYLGSYTLYVEENIEGKIKVVVKDCIKPTFCFLVLNAGYTINFDKDYIIIRC